MARSSSVAVAIVMLAMLVAGAASAPSPPNCDSAANALMPCYSYVTGPEAKPPTECCGGLRDLNTNSPACLCQLISQLNSGAASQPSLNITKAYNLPEDCAIALKTSDCPALANLPLAPPSGATTPSTAVPTTASQGPAAGPETSLVPGNDVPRILPTGTWVMVVAAAVLGVQALF
ncbi:hypothetical protein M758_6G159500 [Ceratodon purpureus]|nr:hypothetical protein M758_6G159500 [Ceratodon purpureus]KAG0614218.1 hypothetical protein M758_6G159500 [Ceratodon purpureus]KAG0614219.1 hypothetical protein M758_6G159500 [Ceratodon purpureus]